MGRRRLRPRDGHQTGGHNEGRKPGRKAAQGRMACAERDAQRGKHMHETDEGGREQRPGVPWTAGQTGTVWGPTFNTTELARSKRRPKSNQHRWTSHRHQPPKRGPRNPKRFRTSTSTMSWTNQPCISTTPTPTPTQNKRHTHIFLRPRRHALRRGWRRESRRTRQAPAPRCPICTEKNQETNTPPPARLGLGGGQRQRKKRGGCCERVGSGRVTAPIAASAC